VQALETLFEVGLPETRGGKWVTAQLQDGNGGGILLLGDEAAGYTGNAWLVREEKNGTAELIILAAGWGFLTQRRKGAKAQRTQSYGALADLKMFTCWVRLWSNGLFPHSSALSAPLRLCVFHPIAALRIMDHTRRVRARRSGGPDSAGGSRCRFEKNSRRR